jgi:hypothetical protein
VPTPDHFVIVGAQRCGTTYLYRLLDEHPEIEMAKPLRPEPKFFLDDARYARGLAYYESEYFSDPAAHVRGEKATSYLESEVAAQRIKAMLPGAPVLVLLRDPVARAVSNYRFSAQHGNEDLPLDEALRVSATGQRPFDPARFSVSPYAYLPRGRYVDALEAFSRHVPREQIHVVFYEELVAGSVLPALYERLGVDPAFAPGALGAVVNASEGAATPIEPGLDAWMRDYYAEPNRRLRTFLSRPLPWPQ